MTAEQQGLLLNDEPLIPTEDDIRNLLSSDVSGDPDEPFLRAVLSFLNDSSEDRDFISIRSLPHYAGEVCAGYYQMTRDPPERITIIDFYLQVLLYRYYMDQAQEAFARSSRPVEYLRYCIQFAISIAKKPLKSNALLQEALELQSTIEQTIAGFSDSSVAYSIHDLFETGNEVNAAEVLLQRAKAILEGGGSFLEVCAVADVLMPNLDDFRSAILCFTQKGMALLPILRHCQLNLRSDVLLPDRWELRARILSLSDDRCYFPNCINAVRNRQLPVDSQYYERIFAQLQFAVMSRIISLSNRNISSNQSAYFLSGMGHLFMQHELDYIPKPHSTCSHERFFGGDCNDGGNIWYSMHTIKMWDTQQDASVFYIPPLSTESPVWLTDKDKIRIQSLLEHTETIEYYYLTHPKTHALVLLLTNLALQNLQEDWLYFQENQNIIHRLPRVSGHIDPDKSI